uniref:CAS1 domain-containing protein 1 n=1 Tax=Phallusia mammillata TaxID=59560 RepID=A0A6F9D8W6_9ASCI|nr:CAS1 domain-containing protein 1 [Phallusia mammillata]
MGNNLMMTLSSVNKVVNIASVKKITFPLVLCLLIIQGIRYIDSGGNACGRLLNGGSLVEAGLWQPAGCMLHKYKESETKTCLKMLNIAFVGDSRVRELFYTFVDFVFPGSLQNQGKMHSNIDYEKDGFKMKFFWLPEINVSALELYQSWLKEADSFPNIIIQSMATHTIKRTNGSDEGLQEYKTNLTKLIPSMVELTEEKNTEIYWLLQEPVIHNLLVAPRRAITNPLLLQYNEVVTSLLSTSFRKSLFKGISVMNSNVEVAIQSEATPTDGLHLDKNVLTLQSNILLNLFCNDLIKPIDGSCCQHPPSVSVVQLTAFAIGICCLGVFLATKLFLKTSSASHDTEKGTNTKDGDKSVHPLAEFLSAAVRISLILLYFYICDRTDIFMKSNKHYTHVRFFVPLLYISLLGVFCIDQTKQESLLNRDQTDEWKGWMQLIILIYHVTGASSNIPIYMHIRLLVAMYLFMTGYGHFSYFWNKGDFGLRRVYGVMFRLNFLTVMLCIVMDRPYQFYYFVPLCSFWFLVLYIAMALWPRAYMLPVKPTSTTPNGVGQLDETCKNHRSPVALMCFKIFALFVGIILVFLSQDIFEALFSWWPAIRLFELPAGSVREWWFRCQLDRFAMLHGAVFCFLYIILKRLKLLDDSKQGCLFSMKASLLSVTLSIIVLLSYSVWAIHCTSKQACNIIHSYASILPITSFILIRNIPGYFRSGYSSFFAWFGKISLELFIGQYHIWLAADTKGVLVLTSPYWPSLNLVVTTIVFVCVAHEINYLTGVFVKFAVGSSRDTSRTSFIRFLATIATLCLMMVINDIFRRPSQAT